jgi:hypothetical protein
LRAEGHKSGATKKLWQAFLEYSPKKYSEYQDSAWQIRDGIELYRSIDDFLHAHEADDRIKLFGKAAIVRSVLEAERGSTMQLSGQPGSQTMDFAALSNTWSVKFMQILSAGVSSENAEKILEGVSFAVFNYDRCLEHFLLHAMMQKSHSRDRVPLIVSAARVFHPYGTISAWDEAIEFGNIAFHRRHIDIASGIPSASPQAVQSVALVDLD